MRPCCSPSLSSSVQLFLLRALPVPFSRKAQESQKEMKLLLDMYKSAPKEQRDKVQLMAAERKAKAEVRAGAHAESRPGLQSRGSASLLILSLCEAS